jgi:hypothetical protein
VHNKDQLVREVVPIYFGQSKYNSFARQLNGWGFKRLRQAGNDHNAYYHERFLRGMPSLVALMTRVPSNQGKKVPYVGGEPNFYEIDKEYYNLPTPPVINNNEQYQLPPPPPARLMAPDVGNEASISNQTSEYYNSNPNDFSEFYSSGGYYNLPPPQQPFYGYPHSSNTATLTNTATVTGFPPTHPPSYNYNARFSSTQPHSYSYNNATNSNLSSISGYNPTPAHNSIWSSQSGFAPLFPPYNYWSQHHQQHQHQQHQQQHQPEQVYSNYTHNRQHEAYDDNIGQSDNTSGPRKSEEY